MDPLFFELAAELGHVPESGPSPTSHQTINSDETCCGNRVAVLLAL